MSISTCSSFSEKSCQRPPARGKEMHGENTYLTQYSAATVLPHLQADLNHIVHRLGISTFTFACDIWAPAEIISIALTVA